MANGPSNLSIKWTRNLVPILETEGIHFVGSQKSSLYIVNSQISDTGTYKCKAENKNEQIDHSATVSVRSIFLNLYFDKIF